MTDFELNKAIAEVLGFHIKCLHDVVMVEEREGLGFHSETDYCNSWSDLMPLVVEYNILWQCEQDDKFHAIPVDKKGRIYDFNLIGINENPQRALAECLLKVLEKLND